MRSINTTILIFYLLCQIADTAYAQDSTILAKINTQVWDKFEKSFITNDADLFLSLHTEDMIRIPADKKVIIKGLDYFESQHKSFEWITKNSYQTKMELRFIERICNESNASEKGIYKFTVIDDEGDIRFFYGKFHVILKNKENTWKIYMDYNSNEENTIDENSFEKAFDRKNYMPFQRQPE